MSSRQKDFRENSVIKTMAEPLEGELSTLSDMNVETTRIGSHPEPLEMPVEVPPPHPLRLGGGTGYDAVKRTFDVIVSLGMLIFAAPIVLIAAGLVRLTSKGPAFYSQLRVGKGHRPYTIYKLRSMYDKCEQISGIKWSTKGDNRITPVGRVLRKLHIDELPQLWNILKGDMSLIGPRPERPEIVPQLMQVFPNYRDRLMVQPGLTGLAQIQLPPDSDMHSVKQKLAMDRAYVLHRSLMLDVKIFFGTVVYLAHFPYATVKRWFRLPDPLDADKEFIMPVRVESRSKSKTDPSHLVLESV